MQFIDGDEGPEKELNAVDIDDDGMWRDPRCPAVAVYCVALFSALRLAFLLCVIYLFLLLARGPLVSASVLCLVFFFKVQLI